MSKPWPTSSKFWHMVDIGAEDECWPWKGTCTRKGYGRMQVRFNGKKHYYIASRLAYFKATGIDPGDLVVRHKCDNPPCCNPAHLELGTHEQNFQDFLERGVVLKGENHPSSKITEIDVRYIRENPDGLNKTQLSDKFGIGWSTVNHIISGRNWRHI